MWPKPSTFSQGNKSYDEYRKDARENQYFWRLVFSDGGITMNIDTMDWDEVMEANAALDIFTEDVKK